VNLCSASARPTDERSDPSTRVDILTKKIVVRCEWVGRRANSDSPLLHIIWHHIQFQFSRRDSEHFVINFFLLFKKWLRKFRTLQKYRGTILSYHQKVSWSRKIQSQDLQSQAIGGIWNTTFDWIVFNPYRNLNRICGFYMCTQKRQYYQSGAGETDWIGHKAEQVEQVEQLEQLEQVEQMEQVEQVEQVEQEVGCGYKVEQVGTETWGSGAVRYPFSGFMGWVNDCFFISVCTHLHWHFPKHFPKLETYVHRSLLPCFSEKRPTNFSFELWTELWTMSLQSKQAVPIRAPLLNIHQMALEDM